VKAPAAGPGAVWWSWATRTVWQPLDGFGRPLAVAMVVELRGPNVGVAYKVGHHRNVRPRVKVLTDVGPPRIMRPEPLDAGALAAELEPVTVPHPPGRAVLTVPDLQQPMVDDVLDAGRPHVLAAVVPDAATEGDEQRAVFPAAKV
jgi:hypothetical protein